MHLPKLVRSCEFVVGRRKSIHYLLPATYSKVKRGFTLIELLIACHPKHLRRKAILPAFTLIELLIVISIIAILVAAGTYSWQNAQQKGRDGKRKSDLKAVQQTLEFYYQNNGKYPDTDNGKIRCNVGTEGTINWGSAFTCNSVSYMQQLPKDPISTQTYYFSSLGSPPTSYTLSAILENPRDPDIQPGAQICTPQNGYNYCAVNP